MSGKYTLKSLIPEEIESLSCKDSSSKKVSDGLKQITKELYDHLFKNNLLTNLKSKSHRKLLIDGFFTEQIFQLIELQNKSALEHFSKCITSVDDSLFTNSLVEDLKSSFSDIEEKEDLHIPSSSSEEDEDPISSFSTDEEDEIMDQNSSEKVNLKHKSKTKNKFKSPVDDQFFKLSNLEEFLRTEDLRAENKLEADDFDEEIDYCQDNLSDNEDELYSEEKSSKDIMYDDFFDPPASDGESHLDEESNSNHSEESDFEKEEDEQFDEMLEEHQETPFSLNETNEVSPTPFQLEQEKVKKTISDYEDSLIQKPEWHLTGEIAASSRPKDSLLHQDTDFDVNAKPVLIEDNDLYEKTEKAIKTIIKNKAYSDGQRQVKPSNDIISLKKEIILEQSKSKKSLAEVYADEYLKKKYGEEEQENPKHVEIKKMMDSLLPELQALFCHIPKPAIPDIKIVSNLPAITVEEVAPTSVSDVTLLAPEEIKKKTGVIKGHSERTETDKKRERRKKKIHQKIKFKKMQNDTSSGNPLSAKAKRLEKAETLKKLKQHRNTKIATIGEEKIKSSKDFFSRLQDVTSKVPPSQQKKRVK